MLHSLIRACQSGRVQLDSVSDCYASAASATSEALRFYIGRHGFCPSSLPSCDKYKFLLFRNNTEQISMKFVRGGERVVITMNRLNDYILGQIVTATR